jgi:hypothetical protein
VAANYTFNYVDGSVTVNQATVTITASSPTVNYGDKVPDIKTNYKGFKNGDDRTVLTTLPTCTTTYTTTSPAGSSPSTSCSGAVAANYTFNYVDGSVTVNQATVTITASSPTVNYGDKVPGIKTNYKGFKNGDDRTVLTTLPTCTTTYTTTSPAGSSPSTSCSGAVAANYTFNYVDGSVTVNQDNPTLAWATPAAITYGTALSGTQLNATATGVTGATLPGVFTYSPLSGVVLTGGSQTLSVSFAPTDTTDYTTPATATVKLQVNKAASSVTLVSSLTPILLQTPVTYTTTVSSSAGLPTGTVTFEDGGVAIWQPAQA